MSQFIAVVYMLVIPLPLLPVTPHLPAVAASCPLPPVQSAVVGWPLLISSHVQTCLWKGSGGGGDYLTLESLSCTACGIARSESGGWCTSTPAPHIPPLGSSPTWMPAEMIPCRVWGIGWSGWPLTYVPVLSHAGTGGVPPETLLPTMTYTQGT